jgi:hypothetical protein
MSAAFAELKKIPGVTARQIEQFGFEFLQITKEFRLEKDMNLEGTQQPPKDHSDFFNGMNEDDFDDYHPTDDDDNFINDEAEEDDEDEESHYFNETSRRK